MKQKRKLGRKLLSFLLTLAMVVGLMPGMSLTAYADNTETLLTSITTDIFETITYSTAGCATLTTSGNVEFSMVAPEEEIFGWANSSPYNMGSLTVTPSEGYTITKVVFKGHEVFESEWFDVFTDTEAPFTCYMKSSMVSLSENMANPSHEKIAQIDVYGYVTPTSTAVTGITLDPDAASMTVGGTETLTATVSPDDATDKTVKWSVGGTDTGAVKLYSDENCTTEVSADATDVLTVYAKGVSAGSATVTCTSNADSTKSASCDVTVSAAAHTHDDITFAAWESSNSLPTVEGNYYLTGNVSVVDVWDVPEGITRLCLNGNTITANKHFYIPSGHTLEIYDEEGGSINANYRVGSVFWVNGGRLVLNGGTINGKASKAGIVDVAENAEFIMNGGKITGTSTERDDASVIRFTGSNGTFTMTGGEISGTTTPGGVTYFANTDVTINISGSVKIDGNTLESGKTQNLYLPSGVIVNVGALDSDASIGVTMQTPGVFTSGNAAACIESFTSDDSNYKVMVEGNELKLGAAPITHTVTITPGSNMTKTTDSGAESQTDLSSEMIDVVYTADDGYYFPENYSVEEVNGITVTRNSYTQITVSGTPAADAAITLPAPTAKEASVVTKAPEAKTLTYNGSAQELVTAGTATGGEMQYALGTKDAATEEYTTTIPSKTDAGTYYVWYKAVGDATHSDSEPDVVTATIGTKTVTLSWGTTDLIYNGEPQAPTCTATELVQGDTCTVTVTGQQTAATAEGVTYTATASTLSNPNYKLPDENTTTFIIKKAPITPSVTVGSWTYGGTKNTPSVTGNPGNGAVTYDWKKKDADDTTYQSYDTTPPTNAGAYVLKANIAETDNYQAGTATTNFTISQAEVGITVSMADWTYGGSASNPVVSDYDGKVTYQYKKSGAKDSTYAAYTSETILGAGSYVLKAIPADTNYAPATDNFTVEKKEVSLSWGTTSFTYDGNDHCPTVTVGDLVEGDTVAATVVGDATAVGTHTARVIELTGNDAANYKLPSATTTSFTIGKGNLPVDPTVTIDPWKYGDTPSVPEVEGNISGANVTYKYKVKGAADSTYTTKVPVNVGEYTVQATIAATAEYVGATATKNFEISPRPVVYKWSTDTFTYTGEPQAPEATITNLVYGDDVKVKENGYIYKNDGEEVDKPSDVGKYTVEVSPEDGLTGEDADNYAVKAVEVGSPFEITKATLTITADNKTVEYGGAIPEYSASIDGFLRNDEDELSETINEALKFECGYTSKSDPGEYKIIVGTKGKFELDNYDIEFVNGTLTVESGTASITTVPYGRLLQYDATERDLIVPGKAEHGTIYYRVDGGVWQTEVPKATDAGTYKFSWYLEPDDGFTSESSAAKPAGEKETIIVKKYLRPVWKLGDTEWPNDDDAPLTTVYTGETQCPTVSFEGWAEEEDESYKQIIERTATVTGAASAVGTYTATVSLSSLLPGLLPENYMIVSNPSVEYTIEKATLPDKDEEHPDGVAVSLKGWTYGDTPNEPILEGNIEDGTVTYMYKKADSDSAYSTTVPTEVGEYTIQATIGATANYKRKSVTSDFTIIPRTVDIGWSEDAYFEYTGEPQALEAEITNKVDSDDVYPIYNYSPEEGEYSEEMPVNAGKYVAKIVGLDGASADNYALPTAPADTPKVEPEILFGEYEIKPLTVNLEWSTDEFEYTGEPQAPTAEITNLAPEDVVTVSVYNYKSDEEESEYSGIMPEESGVYFVKATELAGEDAGNYILPEEASDYFTIYQKEIELEWSDLEFTYDAKPHKPTVAIPETDIVAGDEDKLEVVLVLDEEHKEGFVDAGEHYVDAELTGEAAENYIIINDSDFDAINIEKLEVELSWSLGETIVPDKDNPDATLSAVYNAADQCPEAEVTNLEEADKDKVSVKVIGAATAVGIHTAEAIRLIGEAADNYYLPEGIEVEFEITKADVPVDGDNPATLTMAGWTYGDNPQDPVIENNIGGGTVTYSYKQIKDAEGKDLETEAEFKTAKPTAAGTYTVKASIAATESYNSKELTAEFTIEQRTAELEWGETSFVYDGESHIPTCVVANLKNSDRCTVDLIALDSKDADDETGTDGKTTAREDAYYAKAIGLSGAEAANYKLPEVVTTSFKISQDYPAITINITGWTYGDEPNKPTVEGNKEEAKIIYMYLRYVDGYPVKTTAENSGASEDYGAPIFAGDYMVFAVADETTDYTAAIDIAEFTIEQKTLSLEWTGTSLIYSGEEQAPKATPANLEEGDECTVTVSGAEIKIGEYVATATELAGKDAANYKLPETVTQTFIITKKDVDITVSMKDWTYGATASEPEITVTPDNAGTTVVEYKAISAKDSDYSDEKPTAAGTYTVRVTVAADDNYKVNTATDNFTISPKEVSLKWTLGEGTWPNDDEKMLETIYNAEDQCPTVEVEGIVEGDEVEAKVVGATTAVGTHTAEVVKLTGAAAANYVLPEDSSVKFKIVKQDLADAVIILDDWTYGDSPNVPVVEGNAEGAYITFMYKAAEAEDTAYTSTVPTLAGAYKVKAIISATAGYNGKTLEKEFNINKAPINPELTIADWIYGDTASTPVLTGNIENGEVTYTYYVDETCETPTDEANGGAAAEGEVPVNVGAYTLKAEVATTDNYLAGETTAAFNIGQRTLAITAENKSKSYGLDDPALTYTQTGLVDGDEITGDLVRAEGENVGDYAITQGTVTANDNYTIEFTNGTFTITEAASVVTKAPKAKDLTYSGSAYELVDAGTAANGTMMYALGSASTAPAETAFSIAIPKATDTNVYYVWYMVKGDENYGNVAPACVKAEIKEVDKTELNKAISDAEALLKTLEANDDYKDVADELSKAIEDAKKVAADKNATASTVANAATSMNGAEEKAEADKTAVDKYNFGDSKITGKASADAMAKSDDSAASKKLITDAKTAIDNLAYDESKTPEQNQARIDEILNKLSSDLEAQRAAEKKAAEEAEEAANQKAADEVAKLINALPAPKDITANDKAAIEAARNAYNALTEEQKLKVDETILNKLLDAEAALARAIQYSGEWVDGQWYNADGSATYAPKGQWKSNSKGKWYEDTSGWYPTATWQKIDGKWYYFTADGYMDYSEYRDGYWLGSDGAWVEKYYGGRWYEDSTGYWYQDSTGWYPRNQWLWINGKCYYFDGSGYMLKSQYVGGYWVGPDGSWQ